MKKSLLISLFTIAMFSFASAEKKDVILNPREISNGEGGHQLPRSPILQPNVLIEDNIIFFDASCINSNIQLIQNGIVVYSDIVDENSEVQLPSNLSGMYQLQLQFGSITFIGEIEL